MQPSGGTSPPDPPLHVQSRPGGGSNIPRLLLVKPDRTCHELLDGFCGHGETFWAEVIAEEIEASLGPANEDLVGVLQQAERAEHLVDRLDRFPQPSARRRELQDVVHESVVEQAGPRHPLTPR